MAANDAFATSEDKPLTINPGITSLYFNSQPGDYIGGGIVKTWTTADGTFGASGSDGRVVSISFSGGNDWWYLNFAAPSGQVLAPGQYLNATRYPFQASNVPGLSIYGNGRGSNTLTGQFTVLQANFADGKVLNFAADFEQHSEGGTPALFGTIKYNYVPAGYKSGVLANDTDGEGDPLTARLVTGPSNGALTLNADGTLTYAPNKDFFGTDTFTYVANDGTSDSAPATVSITVNPVNDAPSFAKGADQTVAEDAGPQSVAGWATAMSPGPANESSQGLAFVVTNSAPDLFEVAPAVDAATGTLTYKTKQDATGTATVTVALKDSGGTAGGGADSSASQSFKVTVTPVNDAPTVADDSFSVYVGQSIVINPPVESTKLYFNSQPGDYIGQGITKTWTKANGTFGASRNYDNGVSLSFSGGSDWWYLDFAAPYNQVLVPGQYLNATRFPFQAASSPGLSVTGNGRGSNTLTGKFTVRQAVYNADGSVKRYAADFEQHSEGAPPALFGTIEYNYRPAVGVLANDTDSDTDPDLLSAVLVSGPSHGTLVLNPDGSLSYAPEVGFTGADTFTYRANDGTADSGLAMATINVTMPPPPVARTTGPYSVPEGGAVTLSGSGSTGTGITYAWDFDYDGNTFDVDSTSVTPQLSAAGLDGPSTRTVALRVTDVAGQASLVTTTVGITNVAPGLSLGMPGTIQAGAPFTLNLRATDPGPDTIASWTVDWGDGSTVETVAGAAPSPVHTYATGGATTIKVTATDEDGTYSATSPVLTVVNQAPAIGGDGTLTVYGGRGNDTLGLTRGTNTSGAPVVMVSVNGTTTSYPAASVQRISVLGMSGNDTVTLTGSLPGGTLDLGDGADAATFNTGGNVNATYTVLGGAGADGVTVGVAAFARVVFDGGADSDTLTFNGGQGDDALAVAAGSVTGGGNNASFSAVENLYVYGNSGYDTFDVDNTVPAGTDPVSVTPHRTTLYGGIGNDTFNLVSVTRYLVGAVQSLAAWGDDGNDAAVVTRAADSSFTGGTGTDTLTLNGTAGADTFTVLSGSVAGPGATVPFGSTEAVVINAAGGDDVVQVNNTSVATTVNGGDGADQFRVGADATNGVTGFGGVLTLNGDAGADSLDVNDQANFGAGGYVFTPTQVKRYAATVNYTGTETVTLRGTTRYSDTFDVTPSATTTLTVLGNGQAAGGVDRLNIALGGATGARLTMTAPDAGDYTFADRAPVSFAGMESLNDVIAPQVNLIGLVQGAVPHKLRLFFSESVYATLAPADLAITDVGTGQAAAVGSVTYDVNGNIATFTMGSALPDGNYRGTIAAGAVADPAGNPLAADFSFDFFVLQGDIDRDRSVGFGDLLILAQNYDRPGSAMPAADIDGDGTVGFGDLLIIAQNYDRRLGDSGSAASAPEPAAAALFSQDWARATAIASAPPPTPPTATLVAARPTSADKSEEKDKEKDRPAAGRTRAVFNTIRPPAGRPAVRSLTQRAASARR